MSQPRNISSGNTPRSINGSPLNSFGPGSHFRRVSMAKLTSPSLPSSLTRDSHLLHKLDSNHSSDTVNLRVEDAKSIRYSHSSNFRPHNENFYSNSPQSHSGGGSVALADDDEENDYDFSVSNDPNIIKTVSKHLNDSANSLKVHGADITRDLYKLTQNNSSEFHNNVNDRPKKSRSLSSSEFEAARRASMASSINVPGGFRRDFLVNKSKHSSTKTQTPHFLARNFIEFLTIYGHFAGEELENDEDIACIYDPNYSNTIVDEETPLIENNKIERPPGSATPIKAYFLLLKAFVGTGILFLPKAFYNGGMLFSIVVLFFFGLLSFWCYYVLVASKVATNVSSFGDMGYNLYGSQMKFLILFSIVISQIGFVAAYLVFTAENLQAFMRNVFTIDISVPAFVFLQCLIFIPLAMIRDITKLSMSALVANIFIMIGLCTIIFYTSVEIIENGISDIAYFNKNDFSLFIGVAIFSFEGIGLIIPIQESMIEPEKFPRILFSVIMTISALMIFVASLCYSAYGSKVQTVIILNLPQDSGFVNSIQFFYSLAILLSTPLQLFPAIRIMEEKIFKQKSGKNNSKTKWSKNLFRAFFVILTSLVAYFGSDNLDKFVSFIGCFACIPLVYMYPPMLHYKSCAKTSKMKLLDCFLVFIGAIALVYTTYQILFT